MLNSTQISTSPTHVVPSNSDGIHRIFRSKVFREIKYILLGNPICRRLMTLNYKTRKVALGERNSYFFPLIWVTVDWTCADFPMWLSESTRLPFGDDTQNIVYSAQMMEHVEDRDLKNILREIHRILHPGGGVRIEVPDAEFLANAFLNDNHDVLDFFREARRNLVDSLGFGNEYLEDHLTILGEVANYIEYDKAKVHIPVYASRDECVRHLALGLDHFNIWAQSLKTEEQRKSGGHANALYYDKLDLLLRESGFSNVKKVSFGQTTIPGLHLGGGFRRFFDTIHESKSRAFYSLYVEAIK